MATLQTVRWILRHLFWLVRRALVSAFDDGLFGIAKGAAYSALLSFFPVLATAATILVQIRAEFAQRIVSEFLGQVLPPGTGDVVLAQFRYQGKRPAGLLIVALFVSLWAASSVVKSLIDGFNAAYRVPRNRSILMHSAAGIALVSLSIIPMAGASFLILFGGTAETAVLKLFQVDPLLNPLTGPLEVASHIARYLVAFAATSSMTAILYFYGPYRKQHWRFVWPGAILSTLLWLLATLGFAWYVRNITNYNVLYGGVGTSIALLIWMYLSAAVALYGCAFNAEYERTVVNTPSVL